MAQPSYDAHTSGWRAEKPVTPVLPNSYLHSKHHNRDKTAHDAHDSRIWLETYSLETFPARLRNFPLLQGVHDQDTPGVIWCKVPLGHLVIDLREYFAVDVDRGAPQVPRERRFEVD
jgi:hypothetical protein